MALLVAGCATQDGSVRSTPGKAAELKRGMTKEQVVALYGKTDRVRASNDGETWIYTLNAEKFVPWNTGYRPNFRTIQFDRAGRVTNWNDSK
jgi:outer membrane protein assembly factor BamE (lipoprotein component of BamABCDE complex)